MCIAHAWGPACSCSPYFADMDSSTNSKKKPGQQSTRHPSTPRMLVSLCLHTVREIGPMVASPADHEQEEEIRGGGGGKKGSQRASGGGREVKGEGENGVLLKSTDSCTCGVCLNYLPLSCRFLRHLVHPHGGVAVLLPMNGVKKTNRVFSVLSPYVFLFFFSILLLLTRKKKK